MAETPVVTARYAGTCPECGGRWDVGALITYCGDERLREHLWQDARWKHAPPCPDVLSDDPTALRRGEKVCEECFLVHPEGTCGQ